MNTKNIKNFISGFSTQKSFLQTILSWKRMFKNLCIFVLLRKFHLQKFVLFPCYENLCQWFRSLNAFCFVYNTSTKISPSPCEWNFIVISYFIIIIFRPIYLRDFLFIGLGMHIFSAWESTSAATFFLDSPRLQFEM